MPYPEHLRLTFGGPLFTVEEWSCSIKLANSDGAGPLIGDTESIVDDCVGDLLTWIRAADNGVSSSARLTWVKLNRIGPDGRYADPSRTTLRELTGANIGVPSTANTGLPQSALALTMTSARSRGALSRGRVFIPTWAGPQTAQDPTVHPTVVAGAAGAFATLLRNLGNWPGTDLTSLRPHLVSDGGRGLPDGGKEPVTGVAVGRIVDTQRRRRASLEEAPVSVAL